MWTGQAMTNAYSTVVGETPDLQDEEDLSEGMTSTGHQLMSVLVKAPYDLLDSLHDSSRKDWISKGGLPAGTGSISAVTGPGASPAVSAST